MFTDHRSKRVIFVAHCVLNQNAKIDGCARYPGVMRELAAYLVESDLGIVQMPCPELVCLGLDRQADAGQARTVESEDTRVGFRMNEAAANSTCARLAEEMIGQIQEYTRNGFEVVGILGINGSPTCGVETTWYDGEERPGPGVFIRNLQMYLRSREAGIPLRGVRAGDPRLALLAAGELVGK